MPSWSEASSLAFDYLSRFLKPPPQSDLGAVTLLILEAPGIQEPCDIPPLVASVDAIPANALYPPCRTL